MEESYFPGWQEQKALDVQKSEGKTRVFVKGQPYMVWDSADEASRRMAIVQLHECGLAGEEDLAREFGLSIRSVQRYISNYTGDGIEGLISQRPGPRGRWKITPELRAKILVTVLKEDITGLEVIEERLRKAWNEHVSLATIRQVLLEDGLIDSRSTEDDGTLRQREFFEEEDERQLRLDFNGEQGKGRQVGEPEEIAAEDCTVEEGKGGEDSGVEVKARRDYSRAQRMYLDQLEQGDYNAYAGGLLFAPLLDRYSFLPMLKRMIGTAWYEQYTLEELCLTLFHLDVFGFRSMEDFKRAYPEELGVLIGRSHSPSLFTLRRFLDSVRELEAGERLIDEFARGYMETGLARWGVLYIDGHFLPYYGIYPITKGWHAVRKIPMKGSYHFLGVDDKFSPWLFLVRSSSEDLLQKIPEMIGKARKIGKEAGLSDEEIEKLVVVFDREGYSAELFRILDGKEEGSDIPRTIFLTWAKYAEWVNDIPEEEFDKTVTVSYEIQKHEEIKYFETDHIMKKYGKIRAIVVQSGKDKKRAAIYTNGEEEEIEAERVVQLICRRWGQENLIKELMMKHLINYTPGYVVEEMEEQPMVDNPAVKELKKEKAKRVSELHKLKVKLADNILKKGPEAGSWEEIRKRELETLEEIVRIDNEMLLMQEEIEKLPAQIRFDEAYGGERLVKLNYEKKHFLDCIKVFAYNVRARMCRLLLNYYDIRKEILPALAMIVERGGFVKLEGGRLTVRLRRFANREIGYAARRLCEDLNSMEPVTLDRFHFPIRYEVE